MNKIIVIFLVASISLAGAATLFAGAPAKAPGVVTLDSISEKFEAVRFDHTKHASIAANCGACHHQHGTFSALPCKECHSLNASMFKSSVTANFMACKNCHSSYDPSNPKMPGLKTAYHEQCFQCHRGMAELGNSPEGCTMMCHGKKGPSGQKS